MKELLTKDKDLLRLAREIRKQNEFLGLSDPKPTSSNLSKAEAARIILHTWRKKKVKDAILKSPFHAYTSMIDPNDKQYQLSSIMYGHHVAEPLADAKEQIDNPFTNTTEYYHRSTILNNPILDALFKEFNLPHFDKEQFEYLPISLLANNPIEDILALFTKSMPDLQLLKRESYSIAVIIIPKANAELYQKLKDKIKNMGCIASSWEIAENVQQTKFDVPASTTKINLDPSLPKTTAELLDSSIMAKLIKISDNRKKYPTALLATCLRKLLSDLPPNMSPGALQRIATMIEFTNTFYSYHYPRYARCVYAVLHEISLALIENKDSSYIEKEYIRFKEEAALALASTLSIDKDNLTQSSFLASASTSGASACAVAMRLASKMHIPGGEKPKVKIFKPCYYELPNTFNLNNTEDANTADILMISAGPIVNTEGLTPGVDINRFIKRHIIDTYRTKPVTIIVDATTGLYKNIELNAEAQELVAKGQLSIIIHESHQKFGLIHTDQAQYGRVFGWCSKEHFSEDTLQEVEANTKDDFFKHSDMRIGAFVSTRCEKTLELIKQRHFSNGALLRKMLVNHSIGSAHIEEHGDMQQNLDELYFITDEETKPGSYTSKLENTAYGAKEYRNSFGHYSLTTADAGGQRRMSPDASDTIDNLITASHIRMSHKYYQSASKMMQLLAENSTKNATLPLEEEIIVAGLVHSAISFFPIVPNDFSDIVYFEQSVPAAERKKIISSDKHPKDITIAKSNASTDSNPIFYLGFHSHGNTFRQSQVTDPYIISLIQSGTVAKPENHHLVKNYLRSIQEKYLPRQTNLTGIYTAVGNALELCPSIQINRPSMIDCSIWLKTLEKQIINQYKPVNASAFLKQIKVLHAIQGINNTEDENTQPLLMFLSQVSTASITSEHIKNTKFIAAIRKIYASNQEILEYLKSNPAKYKLAKLSSQAYIKTCFSELHQFFISSNQSESQRAHLMSSMKKAENDYAQILSIDKNGLSKCLRYILKAVTNFIASLTLGLAHYLNYKNTGTILFFSGTRSENLLRFSHKQFSDDISQPMPVTAAPAA